MSKRANAKIKEEPGASSGDQSGVTLPGRTKSTSESTPSRLPSLRGPRDLTLGGIKKKTFVPNIPARKDRVKAEVKQEVKPSIGGRSKKQGRSNTLRQRGRGRGFKGKEIIQSHSIFESGPTNETSRKGRDAIQSEPVSNQMQKPTIKKESFDAASEKAESDEILKRLEEGNESFIADLQNDEKMKPIILPMQQEHSWDLKKEPEIVKAIDNPRNCASIFNGSQKDNLVVFQLPDVLPGVVSSSEDDRVTVKQEPGTQKKDDGKTGESDARCDLGCLSEGKIGKIQVLKSGKCRLVLGNVVLNLKTGVSSCFSEELVTVKLPPEDGPNDVKGHLSVLGKVDHKIICSPDIDALLT